MKQSTKREIRLLKNAGKLFSSSTVAAAIGVVSFVLTARMLGADGYGSLALVVGFTTAILRLCEFQAWQALINTAANYQSQNDDLKIAALFRLGFSLDFSACAVAFLVALASVTVTADIFNWQPAVSQAAQLYLFVLLISARGTPTAILRFYDRFGIVAAHQIISAFVKLAAVVFVAINEPTFQNFVYAWMFSHIVEYLLLQALAVTIYRSKNSRLLSKKSVPMREVASARLFRFLFISNFDSSLKMVRELDVQFVALYVDESAAGILRVARQLAGFAGKVLDAFYVAIYPDLAMLSARREWQSLRSFVARSAFYVGLLALSGLAVFAITGSWILDLVFGQDYATAYSVTCILLFAMVLWGFAQPIAPAILAIGRPGASLVAHSLAALVYLAMLILLVPETGIIGAGWAMVSLYACWAGFMLVAYQKLVPRTP